MNQKRKKQAGITMICGFVFIVVGFVLAQAELFKLYDLTGASSSSCRGIACNAKFNQDTLIAHIGIGIMYAGFGLICIGLLALIYLSLKKKIR